ncbi:MAG: GH92 family glycosyl hydrolase [Bacteroidota bacterium]|nr:GH92 family glycosyl hydrolase [Bacteroidota bacterium]
MHDSIIPKKNIDYIDPTIGNVGQLLEPTRPASYLPNQVVRVYPIRKDYLDDQISSFPLTAVSHRLGEVFSIKPALGEVSSTSWNAPMPYDHNLEITRPWYYSTYLIDEDITVEFTPGKKTGYYRFSFPAGTPKSILFNVYNDGDCYWHFGGSNTITAMETWQGDIKIYMFGNFDHAGVFSESENNPQIQKPEIAAGGKKAFITFPASTPTVGFRYAVSFVSAEQAKINFRQEIINKSFKSVEQNARETWVKCMSQIQVEGGSEAQRRSFYTALYRCHERMVDISEDSLYYSGYNKKIERDSRPFYVDDWSWDTYLALHPLRTILHPAQEEDMLQSYVRMYEQSKWMPSFPVLWGDYPCMNGFHSSIIFLDAYRKGLKNIDFAKAYEGMKKNSTEATLLPWRNGPKTSLDEFYQRNGYFPALPPDAKEMVESVHPFEKRQAVAVTLGASYDDWAAAQMAKELGKKDDYILLDKWSMDYKNLWNADQKFFLPKDDKGNWIKIDPKFDGGPGGRDYYDENNGWTYLWQVQEDIPSLISMMGGDIAFVKRLDQLFREDLGRSKYEFWNKFPDATGLIGQYSMANEPSFHIPYLYCFAGAPWKTQKMIRLLLSTYFKDNIFGIPGDEDGGGMSAFVVFSSMGFYPVTPGLPVYTIGSPVFSKVTIHLENGKDFTLIALKSSDVNKYIQSAKFNNITLKTPWFTHQQLMDGGTLELVMGPKPNKNWGKK